MNIRYDDCYFCADRLEICSIARPIGSPCKAFKKDEKIEKYFDCHGCKHSQGAGYPSAKAPCLKCTSNVHYKDLPAGDADYYEGRSENG